MLREAFIFLGVALLQLQFNVAVGSTIPGTNLETGTLYKMTLKKFPKATITWSQQVNSSYNYVIVDKDSKNRPLYKAGGERYQDALWEFAAIPNQGGWYSLKNRGRGPQASVIYNPTDIVGIRDTYHVVLDTNYAKRDNPPQTYFIKLIAADWNGDTFHQLKFKNVPNGTVTWYVDSNKFHYIEVDNYKGSQHFYEKDGDCFEDTLFIITPAEG